MLFCLTVYLALNALYLAKALVGIDIFPGHHGWFFPLGDSILESIHPPPLTVAQRWKIEYRLEGQIRELKLNVARLDAKIASVHQKDRNDPCTDLVRQRRQDTHQLALIDAYQHVLWKPAKKEHTLLQSLP